MREDKQWEYPEDGTIDEYKDFPVRHEYDPNEFDPIYPTELDGFYKDRPRSQKEEKHSPMQVSLVILEELAKSFHKQVHFKKRI